MDNERPQPAPPANEAARTPERVELPRFARMDAVQARLANPMRADGPANNIENVNPQKRDVVALTPDRINTTASDALLEQRSNKERRELAGNKTVDSWKNEMVAHFQKPQVASFFRDSAQGREFAIQFQRVLGFDVANVTADSSGQFFTRFGGVDGTKVFADTVVRGFENATVEQMEAQLAGFEWLAKTLGPETSKALAQKMSLMKRASTDAGKLDLVNTISATRINNPTDAEVPVLRFLYGDGQPLTPTPDNAHVNPTPRPPVAGEQNPRNPATPRPATPARPVAPQPPAPEGTQTQQELDALQERIARRRAETPVPPDDIAIPAEGVNRLEAGRPLEEVFEALHYPVDPTHPRIRERWWMPNSPENYEQFGANVLASIPEVDEPYFQLIPSGNGRFFARTNSNINSHVWDLQVEQGEKDAAHFPTPHNNRFVEATLLTDDDSSLLALAAAAGGLRPVDQARTYRTIAALIAQKYAADPAMFERLLNIQGEPNDPTSSLSQFMRYDDARVADGENVDNILIPRATDGTYDRGRVLRSWADRIREINHALATNQLEPHHHRWLEFLAHRFPMHEVVNASPGRERPQPNTPDNEPGTRPEDTDFDRFIADNPLADYDASFQHSVVSSEDVRVPLRNNQEIRFPLTHIEGTTEEISTLTAPEKTIGQDAIGIKVRPDGIVNIALADGVSGTVIPAIAARLARGIALEQLDNVTPRENVFQAVHNQLHDLDVPRVANEYIDSNRRQGEINTIANGNRRLDNLLAYAYRMENLRDQGALASTTLALGQYDRANNLLRVGLQGDSQVIIFKADGTQTVITDPLNHQIDYRGPNTPYTPNGEIFEDVQLNHGDVVLYTSDGAEKSYGGSANMLQELQAVIDSTRNTAGTAARPDRALLLALKQKMKDAGISDDVSAIALHHA